MNASSIDVRYWLTLMTASVLGTNTGDLAAEVLGLGHLAGLPWLAALLAALFEAQRVTRSPSPLYFWAAIIVIRTAATNVGDAFQDHGVPFAFSVSLTAVVYAILVAIYAGAAGDRIVVDALYWVTMVVAGVLGTVGGDGASFGLGLFVTGTCAVFGALAVIAIVGFGRFGLWTAPLAYWFTLALVRTAGTGGGDTLAWSLGTLLRHIGVGPIGRPAYVVGIVPATLLSGSVFVALIWFFSAGRTAEITTETKS